MTADLLTEAFRHILVRFSIADLCSERAGNASLSTGPRHAKNPLWVQRANESACR